MVTGENIKRTPLKRYEPNDLKNYNRLISSGNSILANKYSFSGEKPHLGVELEFLSDQPRESKNYIQDSTTKITKILNSFGREAANASAGGYDYERNYKYYCGYELRTVPLGLEEHRRRWQQCLFGEIRNGFPMKQYNGIHIHADKKFLTVQQIGYIFYLLSSYKKFFYLYGRKSNWSTIKNLQNCPDEYTTKILLSDYYESKSTGLSIYNDTIEFRFFPPTFEYTRMMAYIELVDAIMNYASLTTNLTLSLIGLLGFAAKFPERYPNALKRADLVMKVLKGKLN